MTIASKLRRLKAERGVSASEIAEGTGLAIQTLLDLLDGTTRRPHERTVRRLALYFDLPPAYFLLDEDDMEAPAAETIREEVARLEKRLARVEGTLHGGEGGGLTEARRRELEGKYLRGGRLSVQLPLPPSDRERLLELLDEVDRLAGGETVNRNRGRRKRPRRNNRRAK